MVALLSFFCRLEIRELWEILLKSHYDSLIITRKKANIRVHYIFDPWAKSVMTIIFIIKAMQSTGFFTKYNTLLLILTFSFEVSFKFVNK